MGLVGDKESRWRTINVGAMENRWRSLLERVRREKREESLSGMERAEVSWFLESSYRDYYFAVV